MPTGTIEGNSATVLVRALSYLSIVPVQTTRTHIQRDTDATHTPHNTCRGTRPAADGPTNSTQRSYMPCVEGDLCLVPDTSQQAPHGHVCQGGCGKRLHDPCGTMFDENGMHRICSACFTKAGKRKRRCNSSTCIFFFFPYFMAPAYSFPFDTQHTFRRRCTYTSIVKSLQVSSSSMYHTRRGHTGRV